MESVKEFYLEFLDDPETPSEVSLRILSEIRPEVPSGICSENPSISSDNFFSKILPELRRRTVSKVPPRIVGILTEVSPGVVPKVRSEIHSMFFTEMLPAVPQESLQENLKKMFQCLLGILLDISSGILPQKFQKILLLILIKVSFGNSMLKIHCKSFRRSILPKIPS